MTPETKAAMKKLAGMTFELMESTDGRCLIGWEHYTISRHTHNTIVVTDIIGYIEAKSAAKLGLTPGMTIAIYPVGMDEKEKTDD